MIGSCCCQVPLYMVFTDPASLSFQQGVAGGHPCCYFVQLIRCNSCSAAVQRWQHWQLTGKLPSPGKYLGLQTKNWDVESTTISDTQSLWSFYLFKQIEHSQVMKVLIVLRFSWVMNFSECDRQVWHSPGSDTVLIEFAHNQNCSYLTHSAPFCQGTAFFTLMFTKAGPPSP